MVRGKYYNLMIIPEGAENPFGIKMRAWLFKTLVAFCVLFLVGLILFFALYGKIVARAAMAGRLERENEELRRYQYKVSLLEEKMRQTREVVGRISQLAGIDIVLPELPPDSVIFAELEKAGSAVMARPAGVSDDRPAGLPLRGFMTRGFSDDSADYHPGIDIAAAIGTPVLATASGRVVFAGYDSTYGLTIIIEHAGAISTVYGHNSKLLAGEEKEISVGSRIALSGNTGKSTAPHLHYEIREENMPVNPIKYLSDYEESNK
jgi:murein DD-endopeptidase MepM/ murein hydrolase activator NlpD